MNTGLASLTLNGGLYHAEGVNYIDLPGPDDTRGDDEKDWAVWTIASTLSLLEELQGVIFIIDFNAFFTPRAQGIFLVHGQLHHNILQLSQSNKVVNEQHEKDGDTCCLAL